MSDRPRLHPALTAAPRLGLGLAALGRPAYLNLGHAEDLPADRSVPALQAHAHAVLDAAWAAGLRYFDAARSYGLSEDFLAAWLRARGLGPPEIAVGSKWGYRYTGGWRLDAERHEEKDHSRAAFEEQLPRSRERLGDFLWLYQVHSATRQSGVLEDDAVLDALAAELRDRGVRVGLSLSGPGQADVLAQALELRRGGAPLFSSVQATWNLLEPGAGDALAEAHRRGWWVIVKEALANGRLAPRGEQAIAGPLGEVAAAKGTTVDAVALAAALANPWADVVLSGAANATQLASNLAGLRIGLSGSEAAALAALRESPEAYWKTRSALAWT